MNRSRVAVIAVLIAASPSVAHAQFNQKAGGGPMTTAPGVSQQQADRLSNLDTARMSADLTTMTITDRRGRKLNPGQVMNGAKSAASASGVSCKVTEAMLRGITHDNNDLWEVACETGPGYIVTSPGKSQPVDCSMVNAQVAQMKTEGLTPPPGSTCLLKGNQPKP